MTYWRTVFKSWRLIIRGDWINGKRIAITKNTRITKTPGRCSAPSKDPKSKSTPSNYKKVQIISTNSTPNWDWNMKTNKHC